MSTKGLRPSQGKLGLGAIVCVVALASGGAAWAQRGGDAGAGSNDSAEAAAKKKKKGGLRPYRGKRIKTPNAGRCDFLDLNVCLQPWPNDLFTRKAATPTGRRLNLQRKSMPRNRFRVAIDPVEHNRNDGFSPVQPIVVHVPKLDNQAAFNRSKIVPVNNIRAYARKRQPVVVIDARTKKRHPVFAELDVHAQRNVDRQLIIRPTVNFKEGRRYIVALRNLKNRRGKKIKPKPAFRVYRDRLKTRQRPIERRRKRMNGIFRVLRRAGIPRKNLYLAWDFTVASRQSLAGRALAVRDDAFNELGDPTLADGDGANDGVAPTSTINPGDITDYAPCSDGNPAECEPGEDDEIIRKVEGTLQDVPCYLNQNGCPPGAKFAYSGPNDLTPDFNQSFTMDVPFDCLIPRSIDDGSGDVLPARPALFGHGLLGLHGQVDNNYNRRFAFDHRVVWCAVDWIGWSGLDIGPVILESLVDITNLSKSFDRAQQGFLNFMYMGRAMIHAGGLNTKSAFQFDFGNGIQSAIDPNQELVFEGISQGGIMGGALTALAPDFTRSTLNVNGQGYSTLLQRSIDFDAYASVTEAQDGISGLYENYPKLRERQLMLSIPQVLWDRAEAAGFAQHMAAEPLPDTRPHQVLMHVAYGDHQVANLTAEAEARTIGAQIMAPALKAGRHWDVNPFFMLPSVASFPYTGSALVYWDGGPLGFTGTGGDPPGGTTGGTGKPPNANVPNRSGDDPHGYPRRAPGARAQISDFWNGAILGECGGLGTLAPCFGNGYTGVP